jgi:hypothetical protein
MRISELVAETGVLAGIKQDYQKGFDAVDKVLNPKRWGEEDRPSDTAASKSINKLDLRDAVNSAATGKSLYEKDQQVLKQAYAQIKAGKLEVNQDSEQLLSALSAAKNLQKLSPQQQQILSAFAQDL